VRALLTTFLASVRGLWHELRDARHDRATADRIKRFLAADRAMNVAMNVEDLFALQLEEIRNLPEVSV
jgi:hypothetical protein